MGPGAGAAPRRGGLSPVAAVSAEKQRACLLPPDEGPCRALVPRWYYDRHTQSCQEFTYGGCYGNANNFLTFDDCEKSCWTIKSESRHRRCPRGPRRGGGLEGAHRGGCSALRDALHPPDIPQSPRIIELFRLEKTFRSSRTGDPPVCCSFLLMSILGRKYRVS